MRFISLAISALLVFMPYRLHAQDQSNDNLTAQGDFLPTILQNNPNATIFYSGLVATGLRDTLEQYLDPNYPGVDYSWTMQALWDQSPSYHYYGSPVGGDYITIPDKREFKYTVFVMPDSALANYSDEYTRKAGLNGIKNLEDLKRYAEAVYPDGAGQDDKSRMSSLNKLLSYHILPCWLSYDQLNTSQPEIIRNRLYLTEFDVEDFFETLLPHSVMRISTAYVTNEQPLGIFINRKGTESIGLISEGIRIAKDASEYNLPGNLTNVCLNGGYHYINKLLVYDKFTRETALQTRMRIMACTLSPDFINSGGRGRLNGDANNERINKMGMTYQPGYCRNFFWRGDVQFFVRSRNMAFGVYYGDELSLVGPFDITLRLPPVSKDGLYEIRIWNVGISYLNNSGNVMFYVGKDADSLVPCNTPVDMNVSLSDPNVGGIQDNEFYEDYKLSEKEKQEAIDKNDIILHQRGYMKAPDSYGIFGHSLREDLNCYRKVICELYMEADQSYYLRLRQLMKGNNYPVPFSFIEIVPYSVYSGENGPEDKH